MTYTHTQTGPWGLGGHFKCVCVCDNMCRDEIKRENVCVQNLRQSVLQKNDKQNHFQVQATNLPYEKLWKCLTKLQHIKDWVWNNAGFCKLVWFLFLSPTHLINYLTSNSDKQDESTAWVEILLECVCLSMKCDSVSQLVIKGAWKKKKRTRCSCCERSGNDIKYVKKGEDDGSNKQTDLHEVTSEFFSCPIMLSKGNEIMQSVR